MSTPFRSSHVLSCITRDTSRVRRYTRNSPSKQLLSSVTRQQNGHRRQVREYSQARPKHEQNRLAQGLALIAAIGAVSFAGLKIYDRYIGKKHIFPLPVEEHLRKALWAGEIHDDPEEAFKSFKDALERAQSVGMDTASDEYLGIIIRMSQMHEKYGEISKAIPIDTYLLLMFQKFLINDLAHLGMISSSSEQYQKAESSLSSLNDSFILDSDKSTELLNSHTGLSQLIESLLNEAAEKAKDGETPNFHKDTPAQKETRHRLYTKYLGVLNHIGLLLTSIQQHGTAVDIFHNVLRYNDLWTRKLSLFPDSGNDTALLSLPQQAAVHNSLGLSLSASGASQVQAFRNWQAALNMFRQVNGKTPTCEEITLLSNMAGARSQISQQYGEDLTLLQKRGALSADVLKSERDTALTAAMGILDTASKVERRIQSPVRTQECDMGCLTITMNRAAFSEELGNYKDAKFRLEEATRLADNLRMKDEQRIEDMGLSGKQPNRESNGPNERWPAVGNSRSGAASGTTNEGPTPGDLALIKLKADCAERIKQLDKKIAGSGTKY
ncbi:putative tpr domain protein [Phaeomoniella chlamydospora]|uniref:Putative tpr domain protein n=1 Tax=Phaeomoniella chlamydospora TaxID=158046 RepID=A0A0G2EGQ5_PHACM|nr:putative tpr domain protein [Phaeomoniella chlamydospora]